MRNDWPWAQIAGVVDFQMHTITGWLDGDWFSIAIYP